MAAVAAAGPRYAPEDPSLPKPWRGLIDGNTGYLYFWNTETNTTQYERPAVKQSSGPPAVPPQKSSSMAVTSSVQVQQSSGYGSKHDTEEDNGRSLSSRNQQFIQHQGWKNGATQTHNHTNSLANDGNGASYAYNHIPTSHNPGLSAKGHAASDYKGNISPEAYRRQHEITVSGEGAPSPFMTFESTGFPAEILREVHQAGFSAPTPIQAQSWPIALKSRDIVAVAKTGSGKTLGYLLPAYLHLNRVRNNSRMGPTVLVLSPTRELATQILDEAIKFGKSSRISCTCLYGGAPKGPQLRDLDRGVDVVVATPGRLNDILEMRRVSLSQVSYLVLDEADRMLDMGFEPQIRKIVKEIPPKRQTLMFTATWPKEVRKIASDLLVNPVQVNIGNIDELVANKSITQYVEVVMPMEKQRRVEQILRSQEPGSKIIIFCSTKRMCDQLARNLTRHFGAAAIHGDKSQSDRDFVLGQFRTGRSPVLVATDVAARGLDIKDIRVVINYDFPTGIEDYVHRIGRTGRAGATGLAYTFFSDQDSKHASDLVKVLEGASQKVPPEIRDMCSRGGYGKIRRWGPGSDYDGRNAGWSNGGGRGDSSFGGRGGRGPYSGRSESSFGGQSDRDRFESKSYHDSYTNDTRGRHDTKSVWGNPDRGYGEKNFRRSRSRSSSPKHNAARNGVQSRRSGSRDRGYSTGRSNGRSCSPHKSASGAYDTAVRCGSPNATNKSYGNRWQTPSSPAKELPDGGHSNNNPVSLSVRSSNVEEEEGMIPADEDGALPSHGGWGAAIDP